MGEIEDEQTLAQDREISRIRVNAHREVMKIQRDAETAIRQMEQQMREELKNLHQQIEDVREESRMLAMARVDKKQDILHDADRGVAAVDAQIREEMVYTHQETRVMQDETFEQVTDIQKRDFGHEDLLKETVNAMLLARNCLGEDREIIAMHERENKKRIGEAVDALGGVFPSSSQYKFDVDQRLRNALAIVAGQC